MIEKIYNLIKTVSTQLPLDVEKKINSIDGPISEVMKTALKISKEEGRPICQDTGYVYFLIKVPYERGKELKEIEKNIKEAIILSTRDGIIRPNTVDSLTEKNYGNNLGHHMPYIEIEFEERDNIEVNLLLKGGGSENVSAQYSIPNEITSKRDLSGVEKLILYHIKEVQGLGCSPGILGVCIGGDRPLSYKYAKRQLFRPLDDKNSDPVLAQLEEKILKKANEMSIGPIGLGGYPTLLGVKIDYAARHPASFFVSISYLCWVARRGKCII